MPKKRVMYFISQTGDNTYRVEMRTTLEEAHRVRDRWLAENGVGVSIYAGRHVEYTFKPPNDRPAITCSKATRDEIRALLDKSPITTLV